MLAHLHANLNRATFSFFLGFLLLYLCIAVYLRQNCYRDPSSIFFQPDRARVLSYSSFRQGQARRFADAAVERTPVKYDVNSGITPDICIGIGSVSRHGFSYLKETIGSLLDSLDDAERKRIYLVVFLAHGNQSQHEDYGQPWLKNMVDSLPAYPDDEATTKLIAELERANDYPSHARKQKIDYSVLLNTCAKAKPTYTMTLEDDVIAMDGWFHRTLVALQSAATQTQNMGRDSFLYLRLFYDGRLLGWNSEEWPLYLGGSIGVILMVAATVTTARWRSAAARKAITPFIFAMICLICTPMLISLFFAAGRNCMLPKRPGVALMHKYACCAQGLAFPQQQVVDNLLPMYENSTDTHAAVDTFLEDWANENDALRWAVTPVMIQHVGGKSTHGAGDQINGRLTDDMPFDYQFESNDPALLAQEHQLWISNMLGGGG